MNEYIIFTDSACDMKPDVLAAWGVSYINLSFHFEGEDKEYSNDGMEIGEFYDRMRKGAIAKTAAINPETFATAFEAILKQGKDKKVVVFKMKPKKGYRKKQGHRQPYTKIQIEKISG